MGFASDVSRGVFNELEQLLRRNETGLCAETGRRFSGSLPSYVQTDEYSPEAMINSAAHYVHHLVVIVAALYPSEITLRKEYEWAATGQLRRYGIGYREQVALLQTYFASVRNTLKLSPSLFNAVDLLEDCMLRVVSEVFQK
jgi:hypothetical protein